MTIDSTKTIIVVSTVRNLEVILAASTIMFGLMTNSILLKKGSAVRKVMGTLRKRIMTGTMIVQASRKLRPSRSPKTIKQMWYTRNGFM
jgi:hypothetical protein